MKNTLVLVSFLIVFSGFSQENLRIIKGTITDGENPLPDVSISIIEKKRGTTSGQDGTYQITASPKDILVYSYMGMKPIEVIVEDVTDQLNIEMKRVAQELDEVVVKKHVRKSQKELALEYHRNKNIVRTKFGYIDRDRSPYTIRAYGGDELPKGGLTLMQALRFLYPQLRNSEDGVFTRPNSSLTNSTGVIFDLDGQVLFEPPLLTIDEIERVAIIPSASYSVRYGSAAAEGVIVINTKTGRIKPKTNAVEVKDLQAAQAEFIDKNFCDPAKQVPQPNKWKNLALAESETRAIEIFNKEKELFENSPYVRIDAGNYFKTRWNNTELAEKTWNEVKIKYANNPNVLKVVAYYFEQQGNLKDALQIYQKVSALRPNYAQTYRDLAYIHNKLDNPEQALNLYAKYLKKQKQATVESSLDDIGSIINAEVLDIFSKEKTRKRGEFQEFELQFNDSPTRIVLEWNNSEAEFDIQMIKENKSTLIWKHSYLENPEQIIQEKKLGFSTKQFFMDKDDKGRWVFNINYLGNKSADPSYLKTTIQYDYGTKSQKDEVKVIRLPEKKTCLNLFSI